MPVSGFDLGALNHLATIIAAGARGRAGRRRVAQLRPPSPEAMTAEQRQELAQRWAGVLPASPSPTKKSAPARAPLRPAAPPDAERARQRQPLKKKRVKQRIGGGAGDKSTARSTAATAV